MMIRDSKTGEIRGAVPLMLVFFLSGFAGLVYEVLWLRDLSLLFGSTTHSAATTLAVFFLGLSTGSFVWGRRAARVANPMREYALLEVGVAGSACAYFLLLPIYHALYTTLYEPLESSPALLTAAKAVLAGGVLFPAAFFMGGTLPLVGQHLIRHRSELGTRGALLYAVNTVGGASGALAAGFYLPVWLGFRASYAAAIALNLVLASAAWWIGRSSEPAPAPEPAGTPTPESESEGELPPAVIAGVAFLSGFVALGLEVLWTRMFAQVLHNSIYSFAAILVVFLVSLGIGGGLASILARTVRRPVHGLTALLIGAGIGVGASPFLFYLATGGLRYLASREDWSSYLASVFGMLALVCLGPGVLVGAVLPFLLRVVSPETGTSAGAVLGRLAAINTAAGVVGSLVVGFVLIDVLGVWGSLRSLAVVYLLAAIVVGAVGRSVPTALRAVPIAAIFLLASFLDPGRLPIVPDYDHLRVKPRLLRAWEGRDGTVAVLQTPNDLWITLDTYYSLGGTRVAPHEQAQGDLPLLLHPNPRSVFFLGMGTGISAGAALRHSVDRVVTAELNPNVVEAAREFFGPYTNGLFTDPRSEIVVEDGRNLLKGRSERYDVIISDLFVPWQAGTGSLYTREHYEIIRERLAPGGLFAQWLPFYQLTRRDLDIILRTILDVFSEATLWRGGFSADRPVLAVIARSEPAPLDAERVAERFRERRKLPELPRAQAVGLTAMFYAGNLQAIRSELADVPVNTDDRPVLEYEAPIHQRRQRAGKARLFVGEDLSRWVGQLSERTPPASDPYLQRLTPEELDYVAAGRLLFDAGVFAQAGDQERALAAFEDFAALVPEEIADRFRNALDPNRREAPAAEPRTGPPRHR